MELRQYEAQNGKSLLFLCVWGRVNLLLYKHLILGLISCRNNPLLSKSVSDYNLDPYNYIMHVK